MSTKNSVENLRQTTGTYPTLSNTLLSKCHYNRPSYVQGRSIFDAIRTIDDVVQYTKQTDSSGVLITIDFEKAFGSLNHKYLFKVLDAFNFGSYFVQWIRTFFLERV